MACNASISCRWALPWFPFSPGCGCGNPVSPFVWLVACHFCMPDSLTLSLRTPDLGAERHIWRTGASSRAMLHLLKELHNPDLAGRLKRKQVRHKPAYGFLSKLSARPASQLSSSWHACMKVHALASPVWVRRLCPVRLALVQPCDAMCGAFSGGMRDGGCARGRGRCARPGACRGRRGRRCGARGHRRRRLRGAISLPGAGGCVCRGRRSAAACG